MLDTLKKALETQVKDLYSAENQLVKALPRMAKAATSETLREALESHLEETKVHVERLQEAAQMLDIKPGGKRCKAMESLIEEGKEVLEEEGEGAVIDAALIAAAQKVEHYEIASYGTVRTLAEAMGNNRLAGLFQQTLEEENAADEKLTGISESEALPAASRAGQGDLARSARGRR